MYNCAMSKSPTAAIHRSLAIPIAILLVCPGLGAQTSKELGAREQSQQTAASRAIVVQMSYYAQPGKEDEVLQWRLHACDVLQRLGTVRGRVFRYFKGPRASNDPDHPDVIWEGEFADQESFQKYEEIAGQSTEFRSVQQHMGTLVRKTERLLGIAIVSACPMHLAALSASRPSPCTPAFREVEVPTLPIWVDNDCLTLSSKGREAG